MQGPCPVADTRFQTGSRARPARVLPGSFLPSFAQLFLQGRPGNPGFFSLSENRMLQQVRLALRVRRPRVPATAKRFSSKKGGRETTTGCSYRLSTNLPITTPRPPISRGRTASRTITQPRSASSSRRKRSPSTATRIAAIARAPTRASSSTSRWSRRRPNSRTISRTCSSATGGVSLSGDRAIGHGFLSHKHPRFCGERQRAYAAAQSACQAPIRIASPRGGIAG